MPESERRKKLNQTMKKFNKGQKAEIFKLGTEIKDLPVIPTGIKSVDNFLGDGLKHGGHTIIWGVYSCFIAGTKILMSDFSRKNIEDVKIGDEVLGFPEKGFKMLQPTKVINCFNRITNNLVLIQTDKSEITTTPEHPFLAISGLLAKNHTHNRWIPASQLREYNTKMTYFPIIERNLEWQKGWLLGFIMTDGSLTIPKKNSNKRMFVHCYNKNELIRDKIIEYLWKVYSINSKYLIKKSGVFQVSVGNTYFASLIKNQIEQLYLDFNKFSNDFLRGFLAGYCDGDGTHKKKRNECFRFHSTNKKQLELCQKILKYYNFNSNIRLQFEGGYKIIKDKKYKCKVLYSLDINNVLRFYLEFQQHLKGECYYNLTKQLNTHIVTWKANRKFNKKFNVYNIETESQTYVANGFPVHNCGKTALILHAIANAQKEGKLCCYVNTEKPIEPERFKFFGIDLDELIYIEAPDNAEIALEALRTLCKDRVIDLFIIDSTNGLCPKSVKETKKGAERELTKKNVASLPLTLSNFYNVVNSHIFNSRASVVWIGQARTKGIGSFFVHLGLSGGNAQEFYAYQIVFMRRGQKADNPKRKEKHYFLDPDGDLHHETVKVDCGFNVVMRMEKTNSAKSVIEKKEIQIPFYYETGFKIPKEQEEKIVLDGTEEKQEKIREMLIKKGVTDQ